LEATEGISVDAWVILDGQCPSTCDVVNDQAQLTLGKGAASLQIVTSKEGLTKLVEVTTQALQDMSA
jgi:hypothetical protein